MLILNTFIFKSTIHWIHFQMWLPGDMQSLKAGSAALMFENDNQTFNPLQIILIQNVHIHDLKKIKTGTSFP